jgi:hypothetical protein
VEAAGSSHRCAYFGTPSRSCSSGFGGGREAKEEGLQEGIKEGNKEGTGNAIAKMAAKKFPAAEIASILEVDIELVERVLAGRDRG